MKKYIVLAVAALSIGSAQSWAAADANGLVAKKSSILAKMHKKASKALVNAAQDENFKHFLNADESERAHHKDRVHEVSLNVQKKFHVEEMCLIDANGPELTRIVGSKVAHDLSADESGAEFFAPSFAQKERTAYTSPLYMSPDANKWVIAYVTPVVAEGEKKAILHYEHGLDVYQNSLSKNAQDAWVLAVNKQGLVVSDSRNAIGVDKVGDSDDAADYFKALSIGGKDLAGLTAALDAGETVEVDGQTYAGAYKAVKHWNIVVLKAQ